MSLFPSFLHRYPETRWVVPAITAGTPQARNWGRLFGYSSRPTPKMLRVDNSEGKATATLRANGNSRTVGPGGVITVKAVDVGGKITHYSMDASKDTAKGDITVLEIYQED